MERENQGGVGRQALICNVNRKVLIWRELFLGGFVLQSETDCRHCVNRLQFNWVGIRMGGG